MTRRAAVLFLTLAGGLRIYPQQPGDILLASPRLTGPDFEHSVILVLYSQPNGAMGLFLNRPTTVPVSDVISNLQHRECGRAPVFQGGPLQIGVNALIRSGKPVSNASRVFDGVYVIADRPVIRKALESCPDASALRVYVGLCGWSAAQLRNELRRGDWTIVKPDLTAVFDSSPSTLWQRLRKRL